jgi:hypothetical protein
MHIIVVVGFECSWDPESYAGGSVATGKDAISLVRSPAVTKMLWKTASY